MLTILSMGRRGVSRGAPARRAGPVALLLEGDPGIGKSSCRQLPMEITGARSP